MLLNTTLKMLTPLILFIISFTYITVPVYKKLRFDSSSDNVVRIQTMSLEQNNSTRYEISLRVNLISRASFNLLYSSPVYNKIGRKSESVRQMILRYHQIFYLHYTFNSKTIHEFEMEAIHYIINSIKKLVRCTESGCKNFTKHLYTTYFFFFFFFF
jgi:hypothetical protein